MNTLIFINILISFFNFIFIAYIYFVIRDIEKDRQQVKERERIRLDESMKHLFDVKILKDEPKEYKVEEIGG